MLSPETSHRRRLAFRPGAADPAVSTRWRHDRGRRPYTEEKVHILFTLLSYSKTNKTKQNTTAEIQEIIHNRHKYMQNKEPLRKLRTKPVHLRSRSNCTFLLGCFRKIYSHFPRGYSHSCFHVSTYFIDITGKTIFK